jgi:hypothetical protein
VRGHYYQSQGKCDKPRNGFDREHRLQHHAQRRQGDAGRRPAEGLGQNLEEVTEVGTNARRNSPNRPGQRADPGNEDDQWNPKTAPARAAMLFRTGVNQLCADLVQVQRCEQHPGRREVHPPRTRRALRKQCHQQRCEQDRCLGTQQLELNQLPPCDWCREQQVHVGRRVVQCEASAWA